MNSGRYQTKHLLAASILACIYQLLNVSVVQSAPESSTNGPANLQQVAAYKIVDLTHVLGPNLPDYHLGGPSFQYKKLFTLEKDGYAGGQFTTVEHYGTHLDAPSHFSLGQNSIDQVPVKDLVLPCIVIDVRSEVNHEPDYQLTVEKIKAFEHDGLIPEHAGVLLFTGWQSRWSNAVAYRNADSKGGMHFPGFGAEAAEYLVNQRHVASLGIDTLSADAGISETFPTHKTALGKGLTLIENLDNLESLPARGALLICGPLRIKDGTGSPARVMALVP